MVLPALQQTIIGQPRSDYFLDSSRWPTLDALGLPNNSKIILFFTFCDVAYTRERVSRDLAKSSRGTVLRPSDSARSLSDTLNQFPNTYLVIKAHPQQPDLRADQARSEAPDGAKNVTSS